MTSIKFYQTNPPESDVDWQDLGVAWWRVEYDIDGVSGTFTTALDESISEADRLVYFYRRAATEARLRKKRTP